MPWALAVVPLIAVGVLFAFNSGFVSVGPQPSLGSGTITPEHTLHEFGTAKIHGGYLTTSFPLTIDGPVSATDLSTS
ncbi:MAG: hypothetical protein KGK34_11805 [Chloroflexota bacterium]|nr:hypothetical protein [Chloroflexota bacterium]